MKNETAIKKIASALLKSSNKAALRHALSDDVLIELARSPESLEDLAALLHLSADRYRELLDTVFSYDGNSLARQLIPELVTAELKGWGVSAIQAQALRFIHQDQACLEEYKEILELTRLSSDSAESVAAAPSATNEQRASGQLLRMFFEQYGHLLVKALEGMPPGDRDVIVSEYHLSALIPSKSADSGDVRSTPQQRARFADRIEKLVTQAIRGSADRTLLEGFLRIVQGVAEFPLTTDFR